MSTPATHRGIIVGVDGSSGREGWRRLGRARRGHAARFPSPWSPCSTRRPGHTFPKNLIPLEYMRWQEDEGRTVLKRRAQDRRGQREAARSDQR